MKHNFYLRRRQRQVFLKKILNFQKFCNSFSCAADTHTLHLLHIEKLINYELNMNASGQCFRCNAFLWVCNFLYSSFVVLCLWVYVYTYFFFLFVFAESQQQAYTCGLITLVMSNIDPSKLQERGLLEFSRAINSDTRSTAKVQQILKRKCNIFKNCDALLFLKFYLRFFLAGALWSEVMSLIKSIVGSSLTFFLRLK